MNIQKLFTFWVILAYLLFLLILSLIVCLISKRHDNKNAPIICSYYKTIIIAVCSVLTYGILSVLS